MKNSVYYYRRIAYGQKLTKKELEIKRLVLMGLQNKDIAKLLALNVKTIKWHLTLIFKKCGVRNRLELILREHTQTHVVGRVAQIIGAGKTKPNELK